MPPPPGGTREPHAVRSAQAAAARRASAPPRPRRPLTEAVRSWWVTQGEPRWTGGRVAYLAILVVTAVAAARGGAAFLAILFVYLGVGVLAWLVEIGLAADLEDRRRRWATSPTPLVAGWRLIGPPETLNPAGLDHIGLLLALYRVAVVERPVRGHHPGATRRTYAVGLRDAARAWARANGRPLRHGEQVLGELETLGLIRRVTISQVRAFRLVHRSFADAVRALEMIAGVTLIDWSLGQHEQPRGPASRPSTRTPRVDEPARARTHSGAPADRRRRDPSASSQVVLAVAAGRLDGDQRRSAPGVGGRDG